MDLGLASLPRISLATYCISCTRALLFLRFFRSLFRTHTAVLIFAFEFSVDRIFNISVSVYEVSVYCRVHESYISINRFRTERTA